MNDEPYINLPYVEEQLEKLHQMGMLDKHPPLEPGGESRWSLTEKGKNELKKRGLV